MHSLLSASKCSTVLVASILVSKSSTAFSSLSNIYREIALKSNQADCWPDAQKFCHDYLIYNEDTQSYLLPNFLDGHGNLGVFSLLDRNEPARSIMTTCDRVFATFCDEITTHVLCKKDQQDAMSKWTFQSPSTSHHISVAILQSHPSFLRDPRDIAKWHPIPIATIQKLGSLLAQNHAKVPSPQLELDSLLWTPDGALIAGFIDKGEGFELLRQSSRCIAQDALGDSFLAKRPKNLIHATVGRIVGLPPGATANQYQALTKLARHYNTDVLPTVVEDIRREGIASFDLKELSLARNIRWMLFEYEEYATWRTAIFR